MSYIEEYYAQLVGAVIKRAVIVGCEDGMNWPVLIVEKNGAIIQLEVSADPEGNGPGHLFIEEIGHDRT